MRITMRRVTICASFSNCDANCETYPRKQLWGESWVQSLLKALLLLSHVSWPRSRIQSWRQSVPSIDKFQKLHISIKPVNLRAKCSLAIIETKTFLSRDKSWRSQSRILDVKFLRCRHAGCRRLCSSWMERSVHFRGHRSFSLPKDGQSIRAKAKRTDLSKIHLFLPSGRRLSSINEKIFCKAVIPQKSSGLDDDGGFFT